MSKIVFPTQWSESVKIGTFEVNNKPDMCEPDNALSIPEIIARFTRGQGLAVQAKPWRTGSAFEPDGSRPEDTDLDTFLERVSSMESRPGETSPGTGSPGGSAAGGEAAGAGAASVNAGEGA